MLYNVFSCIFIKMNHLILQILFYLKFNDTTINKYKLIILNNMYLYISE